MKRKSSKTASFLLAFFHQRLRVNRTRDFGAFVSFGSAAARAEFCPGPVPRRARFRRADAFLSPWHSRERRRRLLSSSRPIRCRRKSYWPSCRRIAWLKIPGGFPRWGPCSAKTVRSVRRWRFHEPWACTLTASLSLMQRGWKAD